MRHDEDYDIIKAFERIEDELIASIIRNMDRHRAEEDEKGFLWSQWQIEQLKALERYKIRNQKKYNKQFKSLNKRLEELIKIAHETGNMEQEIEILEAIKNGFTGYDRMSSTMQGEFFKLNEQKLKALIKATTNDMKKAEAAVLRMANDKYRKVIFDAQVYANTGAGTYKKAVDMATKDMLAAGLNCIEYANGARHTLSDYADMAIRTASKRAYLQGEGQKRQEWGIATVIMNKRGNPCPKCLPFCGKVLIDDVWSGGSKRDGDYPLMSYAISKGLYHPRCKDIHTTYFPGISTADDTWTKEELEAIGQSAKKEAKQQYAERQAEKFERLAKHSLDEENQRVYTERSNRWKNQIDKRNQSDILEVENTKEVTEVHLIGKIDKEIYKCITDDIITDEVVITDNQIQHIKERHPNDYERFSRYFGEIVSRPDYIIEANKPDTAVILKEIVDAGEKFQTVLRICTTKEPEGYKNSIITFLKIDEKRWNRYLRTKKILYKKE